MATTTPDNLWTPDSGDDYALTTDLAAFADTVQDALNNKQADLAEPDPIALSTSTGWTGVSGYAPRLEVFGDDVLLQGLVQYASGASYNNLLIIPTGYRPVGNGGADSYVGTAHVSLGTVGSGFSGPLAITHSTGVLRVDLLYSSGSASPQRVMLFANWKRASA